MALYGGPYRYSPDDSVLDIDPAWMEGWLGCRGLFVGRGLLSSTYLGTLRLLFAAEETERGGGAFELGT